MPNKQPQLAKLTRPRLHKAVARERLFALLDDAREHKAAICVVGPPGAGKTTLVTSWLDARHVKGIWYQVDAGDADLASFFYYLGEAAKPFTRKRKRPLPRLTPEYLADVEGFSRRFFRELFSRLHDGSTLVLDNYQEITQDDGLHALLANAISELPTRRTMVLISRREIPPAFARQFANEQIATIGWRQLRLDPTEARAIAASKVDIDDDSLINLATGTGGWAAGLILALEQYRQLGSRMRSEEASQEAIFNYFATQIFDRVSREMRRFLMLTAIPPRMSISVCQSLTGDTAAAGKLADLYRRHLFTDRRPGSTPSYSFHALFRSFLLKRAGEAFDIDQLQSLRARCGRLLEEAGDPESALQLYCEALEWDDVNRLVLREAPRLLAQGRWRTLEEWIAWLPDKERTASPWTAYWAGMARLATQPADARTQLEQVYARFVAANDADGSLMAASSVVHSLFLEAADFAALRTWLPVLQSMLETRKTYPSPVAKLQAWSAMLMAIIFINPGHRLAARCTEHIMELMNAPIDANQRMTAAAALVLYCQYVGAFRLGRRLEKLVQPILEEPELTPLNMAFWYCYLGYLSVADHSLSLGHIAFEKAEEIGEREGFHYVVTTTCSGRSALWRVGSNVEPLMKRSEPVIETSRPYDVAHYLGNAAYRAADRGDWSQTIELGIRTLDHLEHAGNLNQRLIWSVLTAWGYAELGNLQQARQYLANADGLFDRIGVTNYQAMVALAHANVARIESREDDYIRLLREGFGGVAKDASKRGYAFWVPTAGAARLCADALEHGIESVAVQHYIRDYPIFPPDDAPESWPWPIRVYTLGRFEIVRNDQPVNFSHKQPRKPLALLKALIALGATDVPSQKLTDALWPDDEGDAARHSLEVALVRLRKILDIPDAIVINDRTLSLNRDLVWTDVQALDTLTERLTSTNNEGSRLNSEPRRAFELYKGEFLAAETDAPWAVSRRERSRSQLVRLVSVIGARFEAQAAWADALHWYRKGIDADDLAEIFYQGVMRCHLALGRPAEGLSAYRRMRQLLSVTLGVTPSPTSEAIFRDLQAH